MKGYKIKHFHKWAKRQALSNENLLMAMEELSAGLVEANLGGYLYKKRIPLPHKGKSAGYRTILAYKKSGTVFFLYGFEKSEKDNINSLEEVALKKLAAVLFKFTEDEIDHAIANGELFEITS